MITETQVVRLLHIPEIAKQPVHRKTFALGLIRRGADSALLLFWLNLVTGAYSHLPMAMVMSEVMNFIGRNPDFEDDIVNWFLTFEDVVKQSKT